MDGHVGIWTVACGQIGPGTCTRDEELLLSAPLLPGTHPIFQLHDHFKMAAVHLIVTLT